MRIGLVAAGAALALLLPAAPAAAQGKMTSCRVGQRVKTPGGRPGTVVAAKGAGCTVHADGDAPAVTDVWGAFMLTPLAGSPVAPPAPAAAGSLPIGEYACYGSGGRVLIGLGFRLKAGGRYTDLDGKEQGRYAIAGSAISFTGGHLGGQTGRDIKDKGFTLGKMVSCQLWG